VITVVWDTGCFDKLIHCGFNETTILKAEGIDSITICRLFLLRDKKDI